MMLIGMLVANDDGWLWPNIRAEVNGTTVIWIRKPMNPRQAVSGGPYDLPVDLAGPKGVVKAFQIHEDYPNILVVPEQHQHDIEDTLGTRLKTDAAKQKFLGDIIGLMKLIYKGGSGRKLIEALDRTRRITRHPDPQYDPDKGYFTVVDGDGNTVGDRGNVVIFGPSERYITGKQGSPQLCVARTESASYPDGEVRIGTGAMVAVEPEVSIDIYDANPSARIILEPFTLLAHEFLHSLQCLLGIMPRPHDTRQLAITKGPDTGKLSYPIKKSEIDVTSMFGRADISGNAPSTREYSQILAPELARIREEIKQSPLLNDAQRQAYKEALDRRIEYCENNFGTEDLVTGDTFVVLRQEWESEGDTRPRPKPVARDTYADNHGNFYRTTDPTNLERSGDDAWQDMKRRAHACAIS